MKKTTTAKNEIPEGIGYYIKSHFNQLPGKQIVRVKGKNGHYYYKVDISSDNKLYHLKFSEKGKLLSTGIEWGYKLSEPEEEYYENYLQ